MNTEKAKSILIVTLSVFLVTVTVLGTVVVLKQLGLFKQPTVVSISGEGKETYKPDLAEVFVSVITKEKDSETAQAKNDEKMAKIVEFLKGSGVKEEVINTTAYNLYPEYEQRSGIISYPAEVGKIIGYRLDQSLSFKIRDLSKVGTIIGGLTENGANQVSGVNFTLSEEKLEELRLKAREKAVASAKKELETTKSLYGFKKAKLISIDDYPVYPEPIYGDMKAMLSNGEAGSSNVSPIQIGDGILEVQVNLTYELK